MADKNDFSELLAEMLIRMDRQQEQINETNTILRTVVDVQNRMLGQMELMYNNQQQFNARQEEFNARQEAVNARQEAVNARQEEVNLAILQELRALRQDVRELKDVVLNKHEERLLRLEDFMRRAG